MRSMRTGNDVGPMTVTLQTERMVRGQIFKNNIFIYFTLMNLKKKSLV